MKKYRIISLFLLMLLLCACGSKEEVLHLGLNAEVIGVDIEKSILYVKDSDDSANVFGGNGAIDCSKAVEMDSVIYVKYGTNGEISSIELSDIVPGDHVIVSMYDSEKANALNSGDSGAVLAEQIQLGTQRFEYLNL